MHVLSLRFLRSWYRCPVNLAIQGAQYIFFALLIGELPGLQPTANKPSILDTWHYQAPDCTCSAMLLGCVLHHGS